MTTPVRLSWALCRSELCQLTERHVQDIQKPFADKRFMGASSAICRAFSIRCVHLVHESFRLSFPEYRHRNCLWSSPPDTQDSPAKVSIPQRRPRGDNSCFPHSCWQPNYSSKLKLSEHQVLTPASAADTSTGFIHYSEFLAATIEQRQLDEAHLWPAFDRLARSHTGFINLDDVIHTMGAEANMKESAAILAHFDTDGDGRISFEEFVNGMRRMGGSTRDRGGLLSASSLATNAPLSNGEKADASAEYRGSGQNAAHENATGNNDEKSDSSVADANERGKTNLPLGGVAAATINQEGSQRPLRHRSPLYDVGRTHHAVETSDSSALRAAPVEDGSKVSRYERSGVSATAGNQQVSEVGRRQGPMAPWGVVDRSDPKHVVTVAKLTAQAADEGLKTKIVVGTGYEETMSGVEEGGHRLEEQGCGCVVA